jgi:hypothetical protein
VSAVIGREEEECKGETSKDDGAVEKASCRVYTSTQGRAGRFKFEFKILILVLKREPRRKSSYSMRGGQIIVIVSRREERTLQGSYRFHAETPGS